MVQLDVVRSSNSALVKSQPLVAVFVGGTSGIGEATIRVLATSHAGQGKGLRLYIVGRNAAAAEKTIAECARVCPRGQFRFVKAGDLALLKDVDDVCAEIRRLEEEENADGGGRARVDLLVMSQAYLTFDPRKETKEGLDTIMSLLYYSRMRLVTQLLPLLLASPLPARAVSVYGAGKEGKLFPADLSLRDPRHYGFANVRSHVVHMTTLFLEALARRHAGRLSLVHVYPGLVVTEAFDNPSLPTLFKVVWRLAAPVVRPFSVPPTECGERILFLASGRFPARQATEDGTAAAATTNGGGGGGATAAGADTRGGIATGSDGTRGGGAYAVNWDGETISTDKAYKKVREANLAGQVWDHTMRAFAEIEAGTVFTG